jgi:aldehyde dehydrogenase (NAD+)
MSIGEKFLTMEYGPAPEDPKETLLWLDAHKRNFGHFIAGKWQPPAEGKYFDTNDPSTGEKICEVAQGSAADVDAAVKAAHAALPGWQKLSGFERARFLYALARQIQKHARRLAVLETIDNGKPIRESRDIDVPLVARHFYYHAGWAQFLDQEFSGYTACGVVGQIIPWNFPLLMLAWKIAPALATGNTVVLKPAEFTPLTALAFAEICSEVGLPPGAVNIVTGDGVTGEALVKHSDVDKIAFTGSTEPRRNHTRNFLSSLAENRPSSFLRIPISTVLSKVSSTASGSIKGRSAAPDRACLCRRASPKSSLAKCRPA